MGSALLLAAVHIGTHPHATHAADPEPQPAYATGPADLNVSWEETRGIHARRLAWAWVKKVGPAPGDGIRVSAGCGYLTEGGDVTERAAKPAAIVRALAPGERVPLHCDCNPWEGRTAVYGRVQATPDLDKSPANDSFEHTFD